MPHGRIQPRTWYVKFGLSLNRLEHASEQSTAVPQSDSEIQIFIKDVIDMSNRDGRRIRRLQHVSFAYKSSDAANCTQSDTTPDPGCNTANIVKVVEFGHCGEPFWIRLCTHGFKTHVSSTSNGRQLIYNQAPEATGGRLAAGHHPGFLLGLRTRSPRPRGLVVEW